MEITQNKKIIYFADLTHIINGVHTPTFPLGVSYVASYAKERLGANYEIRLFRFPDDLAKTIIETPPNVIALSNYSWNLELSYELCSWAKKLNPNLISVFGGPNFPIVQQEKIQFLNRYKNIDFFIELEGEIGFVGLMKKLELFDFDIDKLKKCQESINNCTYLSDSRLITGSSERIKDLNEIPSPYLTGMLDSFFDYPLLPMMETTRGCPFSCAFCADGLKIKNKVRRFDVDRTKAEINYICEMVQDIDEIIITDLNFGMYKPDVAIAQYIAKVQKEKNWPIIVNASAGKNKTERIIETTKILGGSWINGAAIQSVDPEVLKNIKRTNISLDSYKALSKVTEELSKDGLTYTEIILGLPGDSKKKHFESLNYGVKGGFINILSYQAILLYGTDMATQITRDRFQLQTKYRTIPGCVGTYQFGEHEVTIAEMQEIIVGSKDLSFEDYISCRLMALLIETFVNQGLFKEAFASLNVMGIETFDCLLYMHEHQEIFTPKVKDIINNFIEMTVEDLFESIDDLKQFILEPGCVEKYNNGELGINELLVCKTQLYFEIEDLSKILLTTIKSVLLDNGVFSEDIFNYFRQLLGFIVHRKKSFNKFDEKYIESFNFDFEKLDKDNYELDPTKIKFHPDSISYVFQHNSNQKTHIINQLKLYENSPNSLSKVVQRSNLKKMYRDFHIET